MSKKIYLLPLLFLAFSFLACNETEEPGLYDNWRERNEAFIDSLQQVYDLKQDPSLERVIDSRIKNVSIFYKRIKSGPTETETGETIRPPYYNSKVRVFYRGMYINENVFAKATAPDYYYTKLYNEVGIYVFDQCFKGDDPADTDSPVNFNVHQVVRGWTELLQIMVPGDRFEMYVPYQSGYGESGRIDDFGRVQIMGYSTLVFDLEMVKIVEY